MRGKTFASRRKASTKENMAQTDSNPDKPLKTALRRPTAAPAPAPAATQDGPVIGFNELRQACEISALREDLARLSEDAEALCGHIEDGVEQVRKRVAGLCAEELADPDVMAPLLQFAVGTLISIRDRARDIDLRFGAPDDAGRPDWTAAAPPKSAAPPPLSAPTPPLSAPAVARAKAASTPVPAPPPAPAYAPSPAAGPAPGSGATPAAPRFAPPPPRPSVPSPAQPPSFSQPSFSPSPPSNAGGWLAPPPAATPVRPAPAPPPVASRAAPPAGSSQVDWLSPARK